MIIGQYKNAIEFGFERERELETFRVSLKININLKIDY
jgi:hypothetical protein